MEQTLHEWNWWDKSAARGVMLTDCLLWELLSVMQYTFGPGLDLGACPGLSRFYSECPGQPLYTAMLAEHPGPVTGRPGEPDAIARIHSALA